MCLSYASLSYIDIVMCIHLCNWTCCIVLWGVLGRYLLAPSCNDLIDRQAGCWNKGSGRVARLHCSGAGCMKKIIKPSTYFNLFNIFYSFLLRTTSYADDQEFVVIFNEMWSLVLNRDILINANKITWFIVWSITGDTNIVIDPDHFLPN